MLRQVLDNGAALCQNERLLHPGRFNSDGRRLSERMDLLQRRRRSELCISLVDFDLVFKAKLLEEPNNSLAAGFVQPG